jgi:hypothetical protein
MAGSRTDTIQLNKADELFADTPKKTGTDFPGVSFCEICACLEDLAVSLQELKLFVWPLQPVRAFVQFGYISQEP